MFWSWLKYGIGTLFSMAVLSFMVSIVLDLTVRVAAALWAANAIASLTSLGGDMQGLTTQALQQGGIGLLMTALLISAPPMAAAFFGGTMGQFYTQAAVSGGTGGGGMGPAGQAPGTYPQQAAGPAPSPPSPTQNPTTQTGGLGGGSSLASKEPHSDQIRPAAVPPPSKAFKVDGETR